MHSYKIAFEVAGPLAMFARPDTGGTPTSYPVPTWSVCKGLFESIAFLSSGEAWICPTRVEVCRRIGEFGGRVNTQRYTNNYGGPLRKGDLVRRGDNMQFFATVLTDVCYRLYAEVRGTRSRGHNPKHHLQDLFNRRLHRQGRCYRTPCLGWSEFTCSYWGPFREGITEVDDALTLDVPSMLLVVWDRSVGGQYAPKFAQDLRVEQGVLDFKKAWAQLETGDA